MKDRISTAVYPFYAPVLQVRQFYRVWPFNDRRYSQQPNKTTLASFTDHWIKLILAYARHRRLFFLHVEDAETSGNDWDEVLKNERINRVSALPVAAIARGFTLPQVVYFPPYLEDIMGAMVAKNLAVFEPAKQTRSALLYWRLPEEWAEDAA